MASSTPRHSPQDIERYLSEAMRHGILKRRNHLKLSAALLSSVLSNEERYQINQVFDLVKAGRIHLID
ncbi:MAG: hypothetical protein VKI82_12230 [Leptolyngbya sp.]|nr:hypothetical protein [Leptolyngbya sp.]